MAQSKNILPGYLGNMMRNVGKTLAFQWANYDRADQALAAVLTLRPSWAAQSNSIWQMPLIKGAIGHSSTMTNITKDYRSTQHEIHAHNWYSLIYYDI